MRDRQVLAVLLHLIGTEQLRSQRRFLVGVYPEPFGASEARRDPEQSFKDHRLARVLSVCSLAYRELCVQSRVASCIAATKRHDERRSAWRNETLIVRHRT